MKKLMPLLLAVIMVFSLCACGTVSNAGGNGAGASPSDNSGGSGKTYTATVTPPTGWHIVDSSYPLVQYGNDFAAGFWIRKPTPGSDLDAAVTSYRNVEASSKSVEFTWEEVADAKVNGYDAKNLAYTAVSSGITLEYSVYFVEEDNNIFIIVCQTSLTSIEATRADFDAFLSSFTIKEA